MNANTFKFYRLAQKDNKKNSECISTMQTCEGPTFQTELGLPGKMALHNPDPRAVCVSMCRRVCPRPLQWSEPRCIHTVSCPSLSHARAFPTFISCCEIRDADFFRQPAPPISHLPGHKAFRTSLQCGWKPSLTAHTPRTHVHTPFCLMQFHKSSCLLTFESSFLFTFENPNNTHWWRARLKADRFKFC